MPNLELETEKPQCGKCKKQMDFLEISRIGGKDYKVFTCFDCRNFKFYLIRKP